MRRNTVLILGMGLWLVAVGAFAQKGGIRGVVMDADFEVPLPGVKVRISETGQEASTGDTGSYVFENIEPGAYTLLFNKGGYTRITKSEVVVTSGQLAEVEASMAGEYEEMDELVVRDIQLGGASEIGLINLRMESAAMMDSVGADLMGKAGASDAAQALLLVPGTTVQDGKYAVVRGLPDRYVSTQMNGVRLPTADPDKRAVQLDQFPSAMIESMQVSKTFTPDQQGDASGGAVNVVLKGIPDERVLKAGFGMEFNSQVVAAGDQFLTSTGGGVDAWGNDAASIQPQQPGTSWDGAVGVSRGDAPASYKLGVTAGDKFTFDSGIKVGAVGSFFYKRDASFYEGGVDDRYWQKNPGDALTPEFSGNDRLQGDMFNTALYDATQATDELQWGGLGAFGIESENHAVSLLYSYNFSADDTSTLLENTRGKYYYFPGHDPYNQDSEGHYGDPVNGEDNTEGSRFRRNETLEYVERISDTLQLRGNHTLVLPDWGVGSAFRLLDPEVDWTLAKS
ncbi:MAG: carboxypeptidase regulatory-like domain-containing protein, partial [Verrucomicrobiota bacterium]|nr:carboxypeptidase regulatory-like domain-containing protein [Verrucomicrobiota bacterium]